MKIPHATEKPVSAVRSLFRRVVAHNSKNKSRMFVPRFFRLLHHSTHTKRTGCVVKVLLYLANDTVLDMNYLIGFVGYTTLVRHNDNGLMILCVKLLQQSTPLQWLPAVFAHQTFRWDSAQPTAEDQADQDIPGPSDGVFSDLPPGKREGVQHFLLPS